MQNYLSASWKCFEKRQILCKFCTNTNFFVYFVPREQRILNHLSISFSWAPNIKAFWYGDFYLLWKVTLHHTTKCETCQNQSICRRHISMDECNTILSAYTKYRYLGWCLQSPIDLRSCYLNFNPLLHDKIFDRTKLKAFSDEKLNVAKMTFSLFDKVEKLRKRKNAGYQHFLLFPQCFPKPSLGLLKVGIVW